MKIKELRDKSLDELRQAEQLYKEELFNLRMQSTTKQLEKPSRLRELRRGIAQVKTLLREEEIKNPQAVAAAPAAPKKTEKAEAKKVEAKKAEPKKAEEKTAKKSGKEKTK